MSIESDSEQARGRTRNGRQTSKAFSLCENMFAFAVQTGEEIAEFIRRREVFLVGFVLVAFFLETAALAKKPLWFDELITLQIASLPHWHDVMQAIPFDGNPPLGFLLARLSLHLFGMNEIALRLPSILAMLAAITAVYLLIRRSLPPVFAMLGMMTLATSTIAETYAVEARPYALTIGLTTVALLFWQDAALRLPGWRRILSLAGLSVSIALSIASHHYGAIHIGLPLLAAEAIRLYKRRRLDIPMYLAGAAGASMLLLTIHIGIFNNRHMLHYAKISSSFWAKPRLSDIAWYTFMANRFIVGALLAIALLVVLAFAWRRMNRRSVALPAAQAGPGTDAVRLEVIVAVVVLAAMLPIMLLFSAIATGYFLPRYAISCASGIAVLSGMSARWLDKNPMRASAFAAWILLPCAFIVSESGIRGLIILNYPVARIALPEIAAMQSYRDMPIVFASALSYSQEWWYSTPAMRSRLHYLADPAYAVQQPDFLPELSLINERSFLQFQVDDYNLFTAAHKRFLLYSNDPPQLEWIVPRLRNANWSLCELRRGFDRLHGNNYTLYLAEAPAS